MPHRRILASAAAVAAALALPASIGQPALGWDDHDDDRDKRHHRVHDVTVGKLMTLNDSGVTGHVRLVEKRHAVKVKLRVRGLETGDMKLHMSHIHGFGKDGQEASCPRPSEIDMLDTDGDGILSVAEGAPKYGPVLVTLGMDPGHGKKGKLRFTRFFTETDDGMPIGTLGDLDHYAVVVHGLTVPTADAEGDVTMAYDPSTPVACAILKDRDRHHDDDKGDHHGDDDGKHDDDHMGGDHDKDHMDDHHMH